MSCTWKCYPDIIRLSNFEVKHLELGPLGIILTFIQNLKSLKEITFNIQLCTRHARKEGWLLRTGAWAWESMLWAGTGKNFWKSFPSHLEINPNSFTWPAGRIRSGTLHLASLCPPVSSPSTPHCSPSHTGLLAILWNNQAHSRPFVYFLGALFLQIFARTPSSLWASAQVAHSEQPI